MCEDELEAEPVACTKVAAKKVANVLKSAHCRYFEPVLSKPEDDAAAKPETQAAVQVPPLQSVLRT